MTKVLKKVEEISRKYDRIWLVIGNKGIHFYWKYDDIPKKD
jgi:hypothetical protein